MAAAAAENARAIGTPGGNRCFAAAAVVVATVRRRSPSSCRRRLLCLRRTDRRRLRLLGYIKLNIQRSLADCLATDRPTECK